MLTNVHLGAGVEDATGRKVGTVKYLVADPYTNELTHIVFERDGLTDTRRQVVEVAQVQAVSDDGKAVRLNLPENEMSGLPDFVEREYTNLGVTDTGLNRDSDASFTGIGDAPGVVEGHGLTSPAVTAGNAPGYIYPAGGTLGVGPAQMGVGGGMTTPVVPLDPDLDGPVGMPYTEKYNVPDNSLIIRQGANVEALDGSLGRVKEVNFDQRTGKITSFIIEKGLFFTKEFTVPVEMVESANEDGVRLKANKADLQNVPPTQTGQGQYLQ